MRVLYGLCGVKIRFNGHVHGLHAFLQLEINMV